MKDQNLIPVRVAGAEIAHTDSGGPGEAVLLLHGGGLADWFTPLATGPALHRHRVIRMVRAGYTDAPAPAGVTIADHARHTADLLRELDVPAAHVVAHSSAGTIALQLAADHPGLVRSLTLVEPPLIGPLADPADHELLRDMLGPVIGAAMAATARGDLATAFDTFMARICGPDHRRVMVETLGAATVDEAVRRSSYFFTEETRAVDDWRIDPATLARLRPPVLLVQGGASPPPQHRLVAHLAGLIPGATVATVAGAGHLMPLTDPAELGRLVDEAVSASATLPA